MSTPNPTEPSNPPAPPAPPPADPPGDKMVPQAELDRIIQDRLARERAKFADYEDLKTKAAKLDELEQANKSELDKERARAEAAEKKAADAAERARKSDIRSAVIAAAKDAVDPEAVFALLPKDAVTVSDDGQVTGAEAAVKALLESKPYLVGKATTVAGKPGSADGGARGNGDGPRQWTREDLEGKTSREIAKARRDGLLDSLMAGNTT